MDTTNEEIELYPFKHYKLSLCLREASTILSNLVRSEDYQINTASPSWEMRSEAQAEAKGITKWQCYDREIYCKLPKHHSRSVFVKTSLGWMQLCCAKELGLERLPNTYVQPTDEEIMAIYADKKYELGLIVNYQQRLSTAKSVATRKANSERLAKAKALKVAEKVAIKAARTPEEILDKKVARAERRAEKVCKQALLVSIQGENMGGKLGGKLLPSKLISP
ncbi:hypothetical protein CBI30_06990 [Polynucleobacter aenigmaticus]|uniref:Uncharacterized protein n=1 Tax=Polynucleobacter aenigmaticus TaxID=1743164 RepID=A0A254PY09_9BURK|nr:hypothetical protein [Polynucleobacter aenigmaticus]OWS71480.1 hypothetical protein CBI30_06990 [Polynucleobacter aenigmaticus]